MAAPIWNAVLLRPEASRIRARDTRERRDRRGDEREANAGAEQEQPEENVAEVAAADRDLSEDE